MPAKPAHIKLREQVIACTRCPRLVEHCRTVAEKKRAAYRDHAYWGKPVPNFGDPAARVLLVGLAPGAHGANRTGRMFTGDRSGDFMFARLHETGFANQPSGSHADDGLELTGLMITNACRCAPPGNKPTREELANCNEYFATTFDMLTELKVVVCLGNIALNATLDLYKARGWIKAKAPYKFAHAAEHAFDHPQAPRILCCYHPSQQNTFTGKLTEPMMRAVFARAAEMAKA